jgi:hypothetical protein
MNHQFPQNYKSEMPPIGDLRWWYLSFVDPDKNPSWLGACCVEATDMIDAARTARKAGCNPGGEVLGLALRDGLPIPDILKYKLVTDLAMLELFTGEIVRFNPHKAGLVCEECKKET